MNGKFFKPPEKRRRVVITAFTLCAVLFFSGCLLGTAASRLLDAEDPLFVAIADLVDRAANGDVSISFSRMLLDTTEYCLAAFFFGFSVLGIVSVPALSALRGFCLAFSISALIRHTGNGGIFFAFLLFGGELFLSLPCFFVISVQSFRASKALLGVARKGEPCGRIYDGRYFGRAAFCFAVLVLLAVLSAYLLPLFAVSALS